jgi:hypothetical protein
MTSPVSLCGHVGWQEIPPRKGEGHGSFPVRGGWLVLLKPIAEWPAALRSYWHQELVFLFPQALGGRKPARPDKRGVVLCQHLESCPMKTGGVGAENRACHKYAAGICAEATVATAGRIPLPTLAYFLGIDLDRAREMRRESVQRWTREILEDPGLMELIGRYGWDQSRVERQRTSQSGAEPEDSTSS